MHILLIKTSSMGDVFHTFPALTDAASQIPELKVTWVVEEGFAQLPELHPAVVEVIPMAWRRWRKSLLSSETWKEMKSFKRRLQAKEYDLVLDAQCLIKSSLITKLSKGPKAGLDKNSAKEPLAARAYDHPIEVKKGQHAITRVRQLFANALGYDLESKNLKYGLDKSKLSPAETAQQAELDYLRKDYLVFLHGTTWITKLWPESHWVQLGRQAIDQGFNVVLPWGNEEERQRAERLAETHEKYFVLPKLGLQALMAIMSNAKGIFGVDTGLSHVAAALEIPSIALYGATDPVLTGVLGPTVKVMSADFECAPCMLKTCKYNQTYPPCYDTLLPNVVWQSWLEQASLIK